MTAAQRRAIAARGAAILALLVCAGYLYLALGYPRGSFAAPGAGYYPVAVGFYLVTIAAVLVAATFSTRRVQGTPAAPETRETHAGARARVATVCGALLGFVLLLPWAGYPICAGVFVALLLWRLGGRAWRAVLGGVAVAAATYYVFDVLLRVPLPRGVLH